MPGLRLRILVGERFKIGPVMITLVRIKSPTCFVLEKEGAMTAQFEITDRIPVEIMPNVKVVAAKGDRNYRATVIIDAPKTVRIERMQHENDRFAQEPAV